MLVPFQFGSGFQSWLLVWPEETIVLDFFNYRFDFFGNHQNYKKNYHLWEFYLHVISTDRPKLTINILYIEKIARMIFSSKLCQCNSKSVFEFLHAY